MRQSKNLKWYLRPNPTTGMELVDGDMIVAFVVPDEERVCLYRGFSFHKQELGFSSSVFDIMEQVERKYLEGKF